MSPLGVLGGHPRLLLTSSALQHQHMDRTAEANTGFLGSAFFQFETAYWQGRMGLNFGHFGLFSLGTKTLADVTPRCRFASCPAWPVHCLSSKLSWLPGTTAHRAKAVAQAWGSSLQKVTGGPGFCKGKGRRLTEATGPENSWIFV